MGPFRHVLLATSDHGHGAAVALAADLAATCGARLTAVQVCPVGPAAADLVPPVDAVTPAVEAATGRLAALLRTLRHRCPAVHGEVRVGVPWEQILAAAEAAGADVIVLGVHAHGALARGLLGSVPDQVVRRARVPVLTVADDGGARTAPGAAAPGGDPQPPPRPV